MVSSDVIQQMVETIVREFHPVRVILFGSHARGDAGPDSDVDLLVVLPQADDKRKAAIAMREALDTFPTAKDVIVTTPEEIARLGHIVGTILRPALREGKVLYDRS